MSRSRPDKGWTFAGWIVGAAALAALLVASRGGPLGTPAADDYDYLYALRFERPLDFWGPMGSAWYWRPLSRQLYFLAFGHWMLEAPGRVALFHALLLAALFALAYRTARRWLGPWGAAAVAAFPLLAHPARALLGWPTGAQPLLAMVLVALAVHEATARRAATALVALGAALLSHAQAILAVPALPIAAWLATRDRGLARRTALGAVVVGAAFLALSFLARAHGAGLPPRVTPGEALAALPGLLARSADIQVGPAELSPGLAGPWFALLAALGGWAIVAFTRRGRRARLVASAPAIALGAAWFVAGVAFLAFSPEMFTPRHTCIPSLGLAVALGAALGAASEALAAAWIALRLVALLSAPPAPSTLTADLPGGSAPMSFQEIVRLQRTAKDARTALLTAFPRLPRGAEVRYWSLPRASEVAFAGDRALRVWYGDSTLRWTFWDRARTPPEASPPPTLAFNLDALPRAVVMRPVAIRRYEEAMADLEAGRLEAADRAFADAAAAQEPRVANFANEITRLRARLAFERGDDAGADSLNEADRAATGEGASYQELRAAILWRRGEREAAAAAARACLELMPGNTIARAILDSAAAGAPGPGAGRGEGAPRDSRAAPAPGSPTRR